MRELIEFGDMGDRSAKEFAIVTDDHDAGLEGRDPRLQSCQSVEIEIVGRLVE